MPALNPQIGYTHLTEAYKEHQKDKCRLNDRNDIGDSSSESGRQWHSNIDHICKHACQHCYGQRPILKETIDSHSQKSLFQYCKSFSSDNHADGRASTISPAIIERMPLAAAASLPAFPCMYTARRAAS